VSVPTADPAAAVRKVVLHRVADLIECPTMQDAAAVCCALYADLYDIGAAQ
jgi:hypothetical protein